MEISTPVTVFTFFGIPISNTNIWTWVIMGLLLVLFVYLGSNLKVRGASKRQVVGESIVTGVQNLVATTMGKDKSYFGAYILSLAAFLGLSNLSGFLFIGIVRPPTADLATTFSLAILTFFLTQGFAIKSKGVGGYLKSFLDPIPLMLPMNIVSELANPVSLSFRLFGNIVGGLIIVTLIYQLLTASKLVAVGIIVILLIISILLHFDKIPKLNSKPIKILIVLILIPCILTLFGHFYFDIFAGVLQTYIFLMLSMVFISMAMD